MVLDAGHGGLQPGCLGLYGTVEKEVVLDIARRVKKRLENDHISVILTRTDDQELSASQRLEKAYQLRGDLFLSIHANSAGKNASASGVETYCYDKNIINDMQGFCSGRNPSVINHLIHRSVFATLDASQVLSQAIQGKVVDAIRDTGYDVKDRGVKTEGFYLFLHGAVPHQPVCRRPMPISLVEVGFLTNPDEAQLLKTSSYRDAVSKGIANGITYYLDQQKGGIHG